MVVGEMGRERRDYLYDMSYCDIILIIRGYRHRNVLQYQLQRMQAFYALFAMRENKTGKTPEQLWPLYFDRYVHEDGVAALPTPDEVADMQAEMEAINAAKNQESSEP